MAAPCARLQLVRGPVRKCSRGRPFNGIVRHHSMTSRSILAVLLFSTCVGDIRADSPLPSPAIQRVVSPSGKFAAVSDPSTRTTTVQSSAGDPLWRVPGWFRSVHVSDDGEHLATGYGGLNLIPLNAPDSLELVTFWERGRKVNSVALGKLVPDRSILRRTTSHYEWGTISGIDSNNRLIVTRVDGRVFRFNVASGEEE